MEAPWELSHVSTSVGTFRIVYRDDHVRTIDILERGHAQSPIPAGAIRRRHPYPTGSPPHQLAEYFRGRRDHFDLIADPLSGSAFDLAVWTALSRVPAGKTVTYGELARQVGHPGAARAVGGAMARNPIPIVIPCHRVVGDAGSLTGFGLGLWRKRWLLDREGSWPLRPGTPDGPRGRNQTTLDVVGRRRHARP
jgi:methylated-DNA-[protein]-cysteine S-methyltransferase